MNDEEQDLYHCPNCDGDSAFSNPVEVRNQKGIESLHCPFCDFTMGEELTKKRNVTECPHNATSDVFDGVHTTEVCQKCGGKFDRNGRLIGIKDAWNPAGGVE